MLILYGSRRVGKITLLKKIPASSGLGYKIDSGENIRVNQILSSNDFDLLSEYVEGFDIVAIDEAQEIDLIIEKDGKLKAFEFKREKDSGKLPNDFVKKYGVPEYRIIHQKNILQYITFNIF